MHIRSYRDPGPYLLQALDEVDNLSVSILIELVRLLCPSGHVDKERGIPAPSPRAIHKKSKSRRTDNKHELESR